MWKKSLFIISICLFQTAHAETLVKDMHKYSLSIAKQNNDMEVLLNGVRICQADEALMNSKKPKEKMVNVYSYIQPGKNTLTVNINNRREGSKLAPAYVGVIKLSEAEKKPPVEFQWDQKTLPFSQQFEFDVPADKPQPVWKSAEAISQLSNEDKQAMFAVVAKLNAARTSGDLKTYQGIDQIVAINMQATVTGSAAVSPATTLPKAQSSDFSDNIDNYKFEDIGFGKLFLVENVKSGEGSSVCFHDAGDEEKDCRKMVMAKINGRWQWVSEDYF